MQLVLDKSMKAMRSPSLLNDNLPQISNGMKNEPITMSPFFSNKCLLDAQAVKEIYKRGGR